MKLSAFPNIPDLKTTMPASSIGLPVAPFAEPDANAGPSAEPPDAGHPATDFAAIMGGLSVAAESGRVLPKEVSTGLSSPPAPGIFCELPCGIGRSSPAVDADENRSSDAPDFTSSEALESCVPRWPGIEKNRAAGRSPKRPPGLDAENPGRGHAWSMPAAVAALQPQICLPPAANESTPGTSLDEAILPGAPNGAAGSGETALFHATQTGGVVGGQGMHRVAEGSTTTSGLEQRASGNRISEPPNAADRGTPAAVAEPDPSRIEPGGMQAPMDSSESSGFSIPNPPVRTPREEVPDVEPKRGPSAAASPVAHYATDRNARSQPPGYVAKAAREDEAISSPPAFDHQVLDTTLPAPRVGPPQNPRFGSGGVGLRSSEVEKLSAASASRRPDGVALMTSADKTFLVSEEKSLTEDLPRVGTGSAKPDAPMSAVTTSTLRADASAADNVPAPAGDANFAPEKVGADSPGVLSEAHDAVETILSLAERVASADRQTVNLRFSIGESDLRVRVGYWGDEVRTTFQTESPELRAALLHEWQALGAPAAERSHVRFADPVFSSRENEQGAAGSSSDTTSHQHRESPARRDPAVTPSEVLRPRVSDRGFTAAPPVAVLRPPEPAGASQRLRTFA